MITEKQKLYLCYFVSRATFLGIGFSLILKYSSKDAWLSSILGYFIGLIIVWFIKKILDNKKGKTLNDTIENNFTGILLKILIIIFCLYVIFQSYFILQTFMTSFFLTNTPPFYVILPFILIIVFIVSKGIKNIAKVSESLFWFCIVIPITILIVLYQYVNLEHFMPFFTAKPDNFLYSALIFGVLSSVPNMFLLNIKNDGKNLIKIYSLSVFTLILIAIIIMGVFGPELANIFRYPEYMMLKKIKILSFIEKIENIVSVIWIIDGFFMVSLASHTIYDLLPKKHNKKIGILLACAMFYVTSFIVGENYITRLTLYYKTPIIYLIGFILIAIPLFFKTKKLKQKKNIS